MALVPQTKSSEIPLEMVEALDVVVDGWLLLLPESKRHVMSGDGTIDELMFQAHKGVHAYVPFRPSYSPISCSYPTVCRARVHASR